MKPERIQLKNTGTQALKVSLRNGHFVRFGPGECKPLPNPDAGDLQSQHPGTFEVMPEPETSGEDAATAEPEKTAEPAKTKTNKGRKGGDA